MLKKGKLYKVMKNLTFKTAPIGTNIEIDARGKLNYTIDFHEHDLPKNSIILCLSEEHEGQQERILFKEMVGSIDVFHYNDRTIQKIFQEVKDPEGLG